jgi:hypothetical protein
MKELPIEIQDKIDRYETVTVEGIKLYPVRVSESRAFEFGRMALECVQQSLPVAYLSVPLLTAFYQMDLEALQTTGQVSGWMSSAIALLFLCLRLGEGMEPMERAKRTLILPDENNSQKLREIRFLTEDGAVSVTPRTFARLRPVIAAQNGIRLPSDTANPEILKMEAMMAKKELEGLEIRLSDKVIFAAQGCGLPEEEVWNWPILKLDRNVELLRRRLDYLAVTTGQMSGMVSFKDGNPVPSPYWGKKRSGLASMQSLGAVGNGAAENAVRAKENQPINTKE